MCLPPLSPVDGGGDVRGAPPVALYNSCESKILRATFAGLQRAWDRTGALRKFPPRDIYLERGQRVSRQFSPGEGGCDVRLRRDEKVCCCVWRYVDVCDLDRWGPGAYGAL